MNAFFKLPSGAGTNGRSESEALGEDRLDGLAGGVLIDVIRQSHIDSDDLPSIVIKTGLDDIFFNS